jgi:hypothetical protein
MLLPQNGRPQEAPWKGAGLSSHQFDHFKIEKKITGHGSSQIFTDKLV